MSGSFQATLTIDAPKNYKTYSLEARSQDRGGSATTARSTITYRADLPVLREFTMEHYGQTYRLSQNEGLAPTFVFRPGVPFTFTVEYDNPETIGAVQVVSTRDGAAKRMEASWDTTAQAYVAEGFFDPANHSYVPGELSVEYIPKPDDRGPDDPVDFASDEYANAVPEQWKNAEVEIVTNTATTYAANVTLADANQTELKVEVATHQHQIRSRKSVSLQKATSLSRGRRT